MKRILITGANSYVGTNVEKWLLEKEGKYSIDTLDVKDEQWINHDFSLYDVVFHVAGIAHIKEKKSNKGLYYKVNKDLAVEVATKAKDSGVKQFIFMSSMSVYGMLTGIITKATIAKPNTYYGKSKYEAEQVISKLGNDSFNVVILRPPMIYGQGSPGNYQKLEKISKFMRFIPKIDNKRSVLEVNNLAKEIKTIIDDNAKGLYCPQDENYLVTNDVIKNVRKANNKKTSYCFLATLGFKVLRIFSTIFKKMYGNLYYDWSDD